MGPKLFCRVHEKLSTWDLDIKPKARDIHSRGGDASWPHRLLALYIIKSRTRDVISSAQFKYKSRSRNVKSREQKMFSLAHKTKQLKIMRIYFENTYLLQNLVYIDIFHWWRHNPETHFVNIGTGLNNPLQTSRQHKLDKKKEYVYIYIYVIEIRLSMSLILNSFITNLNYWNLTVSF